MATGAEGWNQDEFGNRYPNLTGPYTPAPIIPSPPVNRPMNPSLEGPGDYRTQQEPAIPVGPSPAAPVYYPNGKQNTTGWTPEDYGNPVTNPTNIQPGHIDPNPNLQNENAMTPPIGPGSGTPSDTFMFPKGEEVKPYSGLPESYRDQLLGFVMPQLQSGVQNMEGNIDDYTQNALGTYRQEFNQYIGDEIPRQIRNLAKRGVLDSSVAENTLSQTYSDAARRSSGMGYQTAMEAAKLKTQIPQTIGGLLGYGQYSEDPTVMYRTLAGLLQGMMP